MNDLIKEIYDLAEALEDNKDSKADVESIASNLLLKIKELINVL